LRGIFYRKSPRQHRGVGGDARSLRSRRDKALNVTTNCPIQFGGLSGVAQSSLDKQVKWHDPFPGETTWMSNKETESIQLLQGTLDLIVLRTLATMGSQHAYQIATRLQQISDRLLNLNQGTLYPALIRLEQYGWIKGTWGRTESNREAKFYEITKAGQKALGEETQRWRKMAGLVERILVEES
jgi:PadR family transcriptional regulator, regulatory protein PadR